MLFTLLIFKISSMLLNVLFILCWIYLYYMCDILNLCVVREFIWMGFNMIKYNRQLVNKKISLCYIFSGCGQLWLFTVSCLSFQQYLILCGSLLLCYLFCSFVQTCHVGYSLLSLVSFVFIVPTEWRILQAFFLHCPPPPARARALYRIKFLCISHFP